LVGENNGEESVKITRSR